MNRQIELDPEHEMMLNSGARGESLANAQWHGYAIALPMRKNCGVVNLCTVRQNQ